MQIAERKIGNRQNAEQLLATELRDNKFVKKDAINLHCSRLMSPSLHIDFSILTDLSQAITSLI